MAKTMGVAKTRAKRITGKQKVARRRNIAIARKHKKPPSKKAKGKWAGLKIMDKDLRKQGKIGPKKSSVPGMTIGGKPGRKKRRGKGVKNG